MKLLAIFISFILASCKGVPFNLAQTGRAAGYEYTVAYGDTAGIAVVVQQK